MAQNLRNLSKFSAFSQFRRSVSTTVPKCKNQTVAETAEEIGHNYIQPTNFQKRILVFTKRYPSYNEVPDKVPLDKLHRARDLFRIKVATYSMGISVVGALFMIISGKNAASRGESVEQKSIEWHQAYEGKQKEGKAH